MSQANEAELLMLSLINEERTSRNLDPLEINNALNESSEDHSQWMLDTNTFSHTGVGGSSSRQRIEATDYELEGSWATAENIGWQSERGEPGIADDVADIHESLMNSPEHRANLLDPDLEDIGIGIEQGDFTTETGTFDGVMVTQNFGRTEAVSAVPEQENAPSEAPVVEAPTAEPPMDEVATDTTPAPTSVETEGSTTVVEEVTRGTTSSSVTGTATSTSGPDGPMIETDVQTTGNASGTATGTVGDVTETTTESSGEMPGPDTSEPPVTISEETEQADTPFDIADFFDFVDMPMLENDAMEGADATISFSGTLVTSDGMTVTTDDPAEFESLLANVFAGFDAMLSDEMAFC